jgi:hypothetical protein
MKSIPLEKNMSMTSRNHKRHRGLRQKRLAAILLGSMVMFSTTSVSAGGYPVFDLSNLMQALKDFAHGAQKADGLEYAAQVTRWRRTFQEYQRRLSRSRRHDQQLRLAARRRWSGFQTTIWSPTPAASRRASALAAC